MDFMLVELQHTPYIMCAYDILFIVVADFFTYIYIIMRMYMCAYHGICLLYLFLWLQDQLCFTNGSTPFVVVLVVLSLTWVLNDLKELK